MARMSARFVGKIIGLGTDEVYETWERMGLIYMGQYGDWLLTDAGRSVGGQMSKSNYCPVPTFDFEVIEKIMMEFGKEEER